MFTQCHQTVEGPIIKGIRACRLPPGLVRLIERRAPHLDRPQRHRPHTPRAEEDYVGSAHRAEHAARREALAEAPLDDA